MRLTGGCSLLGAIALACAPVPEVGEELPWSPAPATNWAALRDNTIVPRCSSSSCHGGNPPPAWPPLDPEVAYEQMVNAPSLQASMMMVKPFEPENSYLVLKLRGTAGTAGGVASPMPIGDVVLDEAEIQAIESWIRKGAPND